MVIYLDGIFVAASRAKISVQDRGFRFGDGVFETIAVYAGVPYQWDAHMTRLKAGVQALSIPADVNNLWPVAKKLVARNKLEDATLRLTISRGVGSQGYLPAGCASPTIVMESMSRILPPLDDSSLYLSSYEKISPKALPVECKLGQGLSSTLARMEAAQHGCLDALLLNAAGEICEAASSNIFWRKDGVLYTPALECGVLAGTTRGVIKRLSPYEVREGRYKLAELASADAVVITNTSLQAMPIMRLHTTEYTWPDSMELAEELRKLMAKDIQHYVHTHRFA